MPRKGLGRWGSEGSDEDWDGSLAFESWEESVVIQGKSQPGDQE